MGGGGLGGSGFEGCKFSHELWVPHVSLLRHGIPALAGYKNICDFVACINYASMTGVIIHTDAAHYLANAKIALSTIYHNPNHIRERKRKKSDKQKKK